MESAAQQPPRASRDVVGPVDTENDTASSSQRLMTDASYTRAARYTELRVLGAAAATAVLRSPAGRGALVDAAATAARYGVVAVQAARQLRVLDSRSSVLVTRLASASGIALVILAALKYQAAAVDAMRRLLRGFEPSPPDALRAYPEEDPPATGSSAGDAPGGRRGSEVDADAVGRDVSTAAVVSALSPAVLTALRGAPLSANAVASPSGGTPLSPLSSARAAEILRFIRLLRSTVYGIETEAILALYVHMDRLLLQPGEPLFRRGDGNEDGMYIVVRGQVGLLNDDAPPGEARRPLCVFGRAQTVGENALLATATLSGSSSGSGGRDDDAKPAVTATAAVPFNATRAATVVALGDAPVELLRLDRALFARFSTAFPSAVASFVLSTTSRQWRVAAYLLVDVFRLGDAWRTALEPPSTAPTFALDERTAALPLHPRHAAPVRMSVDALRNAAVAVVHRSAGETLLVEGEESDGLFVLLSGQAVGHTAVAGVESMAATAAVSYAASGELEAESARAAALVAATGLPQLPSGSVFTRVLGAGCIAGGQACIAGLPYRETVTAVTKVEAAWFPRRVFVELSEGGNCAATATSGSGGSGRRLSPRATTTSAGLAAGDAPLDAEEQSNAQQQREATQLDVLLGVGRTLMPLLRLFLSLGLQRLWLRAGEVLFRAGDPLDVYVVISGRLRTYSGADAADAVPRAQNDEGSDDKSASTKRRHNSGNVAVAAYEPSAQSPPCDASVASGAASATESEAPLSPPPFRADVRRLGSFITSSSSLGLAEGLVSSATAQRSDHDGESGAAGCGEGGQCDVLPSSGASVASLAVSAQVAASMMSSASGNASGDNAASSVHQAVPSRPRARAAGGAGGGLRVVRVDVGRGESVGEVAMLVGDTTQSSSAVCARDVELVRISPAAWALITARYPVVLEQFARVLARRLHSLAGDAHPGNGGGGAAASAARSHGGGGLVGNVGNVEWGTTVSGLSALGHGLATASYIGSPSTLSFPDDRRRAAGASGGGQQVGTTAATASAVPRIFSRVPPSAAALAFATIAVVPAGGDPAPISDFTAKLVASLRRLGEGSVLHLTSTRLDAALGAGTSASLSSPPVRAKASAWLSSLEERYRFVVFEADARAVDDADDSGGTRTDVAEGQAGGVLASRADAAQRWRMSYSDSARALLRRVGRDSAAAAAGATAVLASLGSRLDLSLLLTRSAAGETSAASGKAGARSQYPAADAIVDALERARSGEASRVAPSTSAAPRIVPSVTVSAWTKLCVQTADLVFLVGTAHTSPELSPQEAGAVYVAALGGNATDGASSSSSGTTYAPRTFARKELVLLHPDSARPPAGTRFWLRPRRVAWHHHLRSNALTDFDRLARHVAGRAIAVVLGGGGSRGLAHLGVLRVLEENGIPVDVIGGTSQGAFMAAAFSLTRSSSACMPLVQHLAAGLGSTWRLMLNLTLPVMTYFSGRAFNDTLIECFGPTQAEDLPTRFMCCSTDLTNDELAVHVSGPLWRYVRSSMTIIGLLPPINDNGRLLVDGGYVQNLPVGPMRALAPQASVVIAVDVENKDAELFEDVPPFGDSLSGWYLASRWLLALLRLGPPVRIPTTADLHTKLLYVSHSMVIRETVRDSEAGGDGSLVYIRPDVGNKYSLFDYDKLEAIVKAGRVAAQATLGRIEERNKVIPTSTNRPLVQLQAPTLAPALALGGLQRGKSDVAAVPGGSVAAAGSQGPVVAPVAPPEWQSPGAVPAPAEAEGDTAAFTIGGEGDSLSPQDVSYYVRTSP